MLYVLLDTHGYIVCMCCTMRNCLVLKVGAIAKEQVEELALHLKLV